MTFKSVLIVALVALLGQVVKSEAPLHPATGLDVYGLAKFHGYPMEAHEVETEDGYLLAVQRIPHGKTNKAEANKPVVFLMHGLMSCAADWINMGADKSLAYKLAELGYDVWLGNARGTAESRKHKTLDPDTDKKAFWSFSWDELGRYDAPAMIDYILNHTKQEQLQFVGHSQGTTTFFVMASTRPEYNAKIKLATMLGPAVELKNIPHPLFKFLATFEHVATPVTEWLGVREILPRSEFLLALSKELCKEDKPATMELCKIIVYFLGGYSRQQLEGNFITVITSNSPAGSNLKQFAHYAQGMMSGIFRHWDFHNETLNIEAYGTPEPPKYDFAQITAPVSYFYGENDWLVSVADSKNVISQLPNIVHSELVDYKAFSHFDFIWATDVVELLFNDVIEVIERYRN